MVFSLIFGKVLPRQKNSGSLLGRKYADSRIAHDQDIVVDLTESASISFRNPAFYMIMKTIRKTRRTIKLYIWAVTAFVLPFLVYELVWRPTTQSRIIFSKQVSRFAEVSSVIERSRAHYGILPLRPGEDGRCWFHGQLPHSHDREIFKRLGGIVGSDCEQAPVLGARYSSEAEICRCTAPPQSEYSKHFLEIGSADGQYLSNLLFFELQMNWRGVCVEGSPSSFTMLKTNRPECIVINAVIGMEEGERVFYTFDSPSSWEIGMSCMRGTSCGASDSEAQAYADERKLVLKKDIVVMRRLSDIFAEHGMTEFGWIMVDVEGAEDLVVPTIDLRAVSARFISYEGVHEEAMRHLQEGGYKKSFEIGPDVFYEHMAP